MRTGPGLRAGWTASIGPVAIALAMVFSGAALPIWATQYAGGLLTFDTAEEVSATSGTFNPCPYVGTNGACVGPTGFAYVPSSGDVIMTSTDTQYSNTGHHNFTLVFNPASWRTESTLNLSCAPSDPYYPGTGPDYFVPCDPDPAQDYPNGSVSFGSLLTVNLTTNRIVGEVAIEGIWAPARASDVLAWDPVSGLLYACDWQADPNALLAINVTSQTLVASVTVRGGCDWVVYDATANVLLVSGLSQGLTMVDPATETVTQTLLSGYTVLSGVMVLPENWLAVGVEPIGNPASGALMFLNAASFGLVWSLSIPANGGTSPVPDQLIHDPEHGEIYGISHGQLLVIDDTARTLLPSIPINGFDYNPGAYDPSQDTIFLPLFPQAAMSFENLTHGSQFIVTSLLWLPPALGTLALGALAGALVGVGRSTRLPTAR